MKKVWSFIITLTVFFVLPLAIGLNFDVFGDDSNKNVFVAWFLGAGIMFLSVSFVLIIWVFYRFIYEFIFDNS